MVKKNLFCFSILFFLIFFLVFLTGCAPINSEEDAQALANVMLKSFMVGDSDSSKANLNPENITKSKAFTSTTITYSLDDVDATNFSSSHFSAEINSDFDFVKFTYDNTTITYEEETYVISGTIYWAVDASISTGGINASLIGFGNLTISKNNGTAQDVSFDTKYEVHFTATDEDNDEIYEFSFTGSIIAYINDFVVTNTSWSLSFSGEMFGAGM